MTKLLISIRTEIEARIVEPFCVGIIDVKDPTRGALGAADKSVVQRITDQLDTTVLMSIALGELKDRSPESGDQRQSDLIDPQKDVELLSRFRFAKIGLAGMASELGMARSNTWQQRWLDFMKLLPGTVKPVGVAYLDSANCDCPPLDAVVEFVESQRVSALLLDTFHKSSGNVISLLGTQKLKQLIRRARNQKITTVVAGSVKVRHLKKLIECEPDFIGVRGAVCNDGRSQLDRTKLNRFCEAFRQTLKRRFGSMSQATEPTG